MYQMPNPHPVVGNGQHLGVAALVLAATLLSVELFQPPEKLEDPKKALGWTHPKKLRKERDEATELS